MLKKKQQSETQKSKQTKIWLCDIMNEKKTYKQKLIQTNKEKEKKKKKKSYRITIPLSPSICVFNLMHSNSDNVLFAVQSDKTLVIVSKHAKVCAFAT